MEEILRAGFEELGVPLSPEAEGQLRAFYTLLEEKNKVMNLTAIKGEADVARQHFLDCGAVLKFLDLRAKTVLDVGSGAGFPGLVLKILCPELELLSLDSQQKRVDFQWEVIRALQLGGVYAMAGRAEEMKPLRGRFDAVTSRAVARLNVLAELCLPQMRVGGVFAAMKGPAPEEEITEAARGIALLGGAEPRVERYTIPGTDAVHSLVLIEKTAPTPKTYPRRFAAIKKQPL